MRNQAEWDLNKVLIYRAKTIVPDMVYSLQFVLISELLTLKGLIFTLNINTDPTV